MKQFILVLGSSLMMISGFAQQKEGKVTYERTSSFQARLNINGEESVVPQTRKDNFELSFTAEKTLWKAAEDNNDNMETSDGGGGMQIRMIASGSDDVLFTNLGAGTRVEKRELMDKSFIIDDSIRSLKWKISGETKKILDHVCMKATATQVRQSMRMTMENGKMERKEIMDTTNIVAWFTNDIPVSAGPGEYQGQLPGLILELNAGDGRQVYVAKSISPKVDLAIIKEPSGKKHYTPAEFRKETDKMMKEMQDNMQGGGQRTIRINN